MDPTDSTILGLDPAILVPGAMLVIGLVLWAFGRKVLRGAMAASGLLAGGAVGWVLAGALARAEVVDVPPVLMALVTGLTLACLAALAYRFAVTVALMVVFAVAGPLGIWTAAELRLPEFDVRWPGTESVEDAGAEVEAEADERATIEAFLDAIGVAVGAPGVESDDGDPLPPLPEGTPEGFQEHWDRILGTESEALGLDSVETAQRIDEARTFAGKVAVWAKDAWAQTPPRVRTALVAAALIGLLLGLLLGTLAPHFSAALVTAFGGGGLALAGLVGVGDHFGFAGSGVLPVSPAAWSLWWLILSIIGLSIQWMARPRNADNRSERRGPRRRRKARKPTT